MDLNTLLGFLAQKVAESFAHLIWAKYVKIQMNRMSSLKDGFFHLSVDLFSIDENIDLISTNSIEQTAFATQADNACYFMGQLLSRQLFSWCPGSFDLSESLSSRDV
jgi:hypothetical protein